MKVWKLICLRVITNPHKEDMITDIPEKTFIIDGYNIADRMLEGVLFSVQFDENGKVVKVFIEDEHTKTWFEDNYNSKKFYDKAKKYAERVLATGDEVDIPGSLKKKYYVNGINCSGISIEEV